jgi:hypothetical protein
MSSDELQRILLTNVAEVKFVRRRPKPGSPPTRRIFCTNNAELLRRVLERDGWVVDNAADGLKLWLSWPGRGQRSSSLT